MVLVIVAVIVLVVLGLIGWCIWRFFKKKRPKGAEKDKAEDDENALVDNEEANAEEVWLPLGVVYKYDVTSEGVGGKVASKKLMKEGLAYSTL